MTIKILIVEDEFLIAMLIEDHLSEAGYVVAGMAADAATALDLAAECVPDIATMDIRLARDGDGETLARELFSRFGIRSLFISADVDMALRERSVDYEPLGFLSKPYVERHLIAIIEQHLSELGQEPEAHASEIVSQPDG